MKIINNKSFKKISINFCIFLIIHKEDFRYIKYNYYEIFLIDLYSNKIK